MYSTSQGWIYLKFISGALDMDAVMIMMMIALKGANRDFYYLLTALRTVSKTSAQAAMAQSRANHVQHIGRS